MHLGFPSEVLENETTDAKIQVEIKVIFRIKKKSQDVCLCAQKYLAVRWTELDTLALHYLCHILIRI